MRRVYLDYNATTPVAPEVLEAMKPYFLDSFGNPSSLHAEGAKARKALEESREAMASTLKSQPDEIFFTSGGTEANNLAIRGCLLNPPLSPFVKGGLGGFSDAIPHVITTAIEHSSVLAPLESLEKKGLIEVTRLPVDEEGKIDIATLKSAIRDNTVLISVMFANNEIGNIYPIYEIGRIARERKIIFHTDAVQAVGKLPVDLSKLPVDLLSFSSHKINGPKGVGGLFIRKGIKIQSQILGGAQEMEKRGGTENLPGIVGFARAMQLAHENFDQQFQSVRELRDSLERGLVENISDLHVHGDERARLPNTLNITMEGITSETILIALDREGIAVSSGSACASGSIEPSHVLLAMGLSKAQAKGAVRFSLGRWTTKDDIEYVLHKMPEVVKRLR